MHYPHKKSAPNTTASVSKMKCTGNTVIRPVTTPTRKTQADSRRLHRDGIRVQHEIVVLVHDPPGHGALVTKGGYRPSSTSVSQLEPSFIERLVQRALISSEFPHQLQILFIGSQSKIAGQPHQTSCGASCVLDAPLLMSTRSSMPLPLKVHQTLEEAIAPLRWSECPRTFKSRSEGVGAHALQVPIATCAFESRLQILPKGFTWPKPWPICASPVALSESVSASNQSDSVPVIITHSTKYIPDVFRAECRIGNRRTSRFDNWSLGVDINETSGSCTKRLLAMPLERIAR